MEKEFILGELVFVKDLPTEKVKAPHTKLGWNYFYKSIFKCFCGKEFITTKRRVRLGYTKSCGCYRRHKDTLFGYKHGGCESNLYPLWCSLKGRCFNTKNKAYLDYGGRGITVCDEWLNDFPIFQEWALKNGYKQGLSLDREDNDSGYSPENCRWVNRYIQNTNQRNKYNKTGYNGVNNCGLAFVAAIRIYGKQVYLGYYDTAEEASEVYQKAKKERDKEYNINKTKITNKQKTI